MKNKRLKDNAKNFCFYLKYDIIKTALKTGTTPIKCKK